MVVQNHSVINCIYFFVTIKPCLLFYVFAFSFWISINILSMNLRHLGNSRNWPPNVTLSKDDGQYISSAKVIFIVDLTWEEIIGITQLTSSSNSINVKLVKFLNKKGVAYIMAMYPHCHLRKNHHLNLKMTYCVGYIGW
jgi:hypothetical protein